VMPEKTPPTPSFTAAPTERLATTVADRYRQAT
jgi:hypothetical protein